MVVVCPKCKTKLKVDETKLSPQGSRFKCPKCATILVVKKPVVQQKKSLESRKILIAHSNSSVVDTVKNILAAEGYSVVVAADGIDAMVKALKELPSFAVVEVALPKIYGFEVCKKIKSRPETKDMKLILVPSIYDKTKYRREPVSLYGADDYIEEHDLSVRLVESINRISSGEPPAAEKEVQQKEELKSPDADRVEKKPEVPAQPEIKPSLDDKADEFVEKARRLARTIINDIYLYNSAKVEEAIKRDNFYSVFANEVKEGQRLYEGRIPQETRNKANFYREAIDNFLAAKKKSIMQ